MKSIIKITTLATILMLLSGVASSQPVQVSSDKITMHSIPKTDLNMIGMQMPLPETWNLDNNAAEGQPFIIAPGEIEIYAFPQAQGFLYSEDSLTAQYYHNAMGTSIREPKGIDAIIENDLKPLVEKNGYRFIKQYPLNDIAINVATFTASLYNPLQLNNLVQASGTEWVNKDGNKLLIVLQYTETGSSSSILSWGYSAHSLQARPQVFEQACDYFINGLINLQYNPDDIAIYNKIQKDEWTKSQAGTLEYSEGDSYVLPQDGSYDPDSNYENDYSNWKKVNPEK